MAHHPDHGDSFLPILEEIFPGSAIPSFYEEHERRIWTALFAFPPLAYVAAGAQMLYFLNVVLAVVFLSQLKAWVLGLYFIASGLALSFGGRNARVLGVAIIAAAMYIALAWGRPVPAPIVPPANVSSSPLKRP